MKYLSLVALCCFLLGGCSAPQRSDGGDVVGNGLMSSDMATPKAMDENSCGCGEGSKSCSMHEGAAMGCDAHGKGKGHKDGGCGCGKAGGSKKKAK